MDSNKSYHYSDYLKKYTSDYRAREYWKLFKIRGRKDNRHIQFNLCESCITNLYANKNKLMCNINKEGKLQNINISIDICELCIERNLFEVSSYVYKCSLKRPINGSAEKFYTWNKDVGSEKCKKVCKESGEISEEIVYGRQTKSLKPRKNKQSVDDNSEYERKPNEVCVKRKRKNKPLTNVSESELLPNEV